MKKEKRFTIELTFSDESTTYFDVVVEGEKHHYMALLMWATRGTLMASNALRATCYNDQGWDVISYIK